MNSDFTEAKLTRELVVQHAQVKYWAVFVSPAFELWGEARKITQGIYETFSPFGIRLADIRGESGTTAGEQTVTVNIGAEATYKFRFDSVEMTSFRYSEESSRQLASLLSAAAKWIRDSAPSVRFASHQFVYSAHCALQSGDAEDFLKTISRAAPKAGGNDRGTGLIFHCDVPTKNWATQVVIDKSMLVNNGLYVALTISIAGDSVDFDSVGVGGYAYLAGILSELGLNWGFPKRA